jgi:hypothetical protein
MEQRAGHTLARLVNKFLRGDQSLNDVVAITWGGIAGAPERNPNPPTYEELGQLIVAHGYPRLFMMCGKYVGAAYAGRPIDDIVLPKEVKKKNTTVDLELNG